MECCVWKTGEKRHLFYFRGVTFLSDSVRFDFFSDLNAEFGYILEVGRLFHGLTQLIRTKYTSPCLPNLPFISKTL